MASTQRNGEVNGQKQKSLNPEAEFAQAFKELAQGERHATNMENQLDALEKKIDEMLAQAEQQHKDDSASSSSNGPRPDAGDQKSKDP